MTHCTRQRTCTSIAKSVVKPLGEAQLRQRIFGFGALAEDVHRAKKKPGGCNLPVAKNEVEFKSAAVAPHAPTEPRTAPTPAFRAEMADAIAAAISVAVSVAITPARSTPAAMPAMIVVSFLNHRLGCRSCRKHRLCRCRGREQNAAECNKSKRNFSHWMSPLL